MKTQPPRLRLVSTTILACAFSWAALSAVDGSRPVLAVAASAQSSSDQSGSVDLDQVLFVQDPQFKNGRPGISLLWIPEPLQHICLGKTETQCATIDYCIRTTNPGSAQCRNLGIPRARLPHYPPNMRPRRMLSITLMYLEPTKFEPLQSFFKSAPAASLDHISMSARIKARIRFTRTADDDDFTLLEVLAVPPF